MSGVMRKKVTKNDNDVNRATQNLRQSHSSQVNLLENSGLFRTPGGHYILLRPAHSPIHGIEPTPDTESTTARRGELRR
jgi:hypothetical protein